MKGPLWEDFILFSRAHVLSGDVDPGAAVLRKLYATEKVDPERALWRTLVYLTWYDLGSAERVWRAHPKPARIEPVRFAALPTGVERRGFRGLVGVERACAFITGVLDRGSGSLLRWVCACGSGEPGWRTVRRELESVPGAGAWASLRWAELLRGAHDLPFAAPDVGRGAPIPVLAALVDRSEKIVTADITAQKDLLAEAIRRGVPFVGLHQLRASLTAFGELRRGAYYVGHDIDLQMDQLDGGAPELWAARAAFPKAYRGERASKPWSGVRKEMKRAYAARGELVNLWV